MNLRGPPTGPVFNGISRQDAVKDEEEKKRSNVVVQQASLVRSTPIKDPMQYRLLVRAADMEISPMDTRGQGC